MHILCPHCHNPIELLKVTLCEEITCSSCGSSFCLKMGSTTDHVPRSGQTLGKFELLDKVGHGAFGTVYKARDPELDRIVAIKVPRTGNLASAHELDRFLREARSAAQLRHPSIVTVHYVGQVGGVHFIISDFVEGVTLADLLSSRRLSFAEVAELVATVADALHYAHEHGVIHRDVKPSNIMIGNDGTPRVMDFGLAKREAGEITMTVEGQVLGTPAYMPPEQARGEGHAVDARGDVYSLGVVLYLLLTGELPFRGTQRMLLHQVLHDDPRSPRSLNDRIPRDLQTIALKAMAKEPGRRYATARELADDLRRWQKGEPIQARPVGRVERGVWWVKRNPALAGSLATVVAVLVMGTVVSAFFDRDARNKEGIAVAALNELEEKNKELEHSREEVIKQNAALIHSRDKLDGALVRTWLSPLAETPGPLNDAEIAAFTQIAAHRNDHLPERFVMEALRDRQGIRRLGVRSVYAPHAVVGLDTQQRQKMEQVLMNAMAAQDLPEDMRTDLALAASGLGDLTPATEEAVAKVLLLALPRTNNVLELQSVAEGLSLVSGRLETKEAAVSIAHAMTKTDHYPGLESLTNCLSTVSSRLEPKEAAAILMEAVIQTATDDHHEALNFLADSLLVVSARMEAKPTVTLLIQAMANTEKNSVLKLLGKVLSATSARLDAREGSDILMQAMLKTKHDVALGYLASALSVVAVRMEGKEAERMSTVAIAKLTQAMAKTDKNEALNSLAMGLSAVLANHRDAKEAARVSKKAVAILLAAMARRQIEDLGCWDLAEGLSALSANLEAKEAAAMLTRAMGRTKDNWTLSHLVKGLSAVSGRLEAKEAAEIATMLTLSLVKKERYYRDDVGDLVWGLSVVLGHLEAKEAREIAFLLIQAISKAKDRYAHDYLERSLSAALARLEAKDAAAMVTQAMTQTNNDMALGYFARVLSAVVCRLEAKEAERVSTQAIALVMQAMGKTDKTKTLLSLASGLSKMLARVEPEIAARGATPAVAILFSAMTKTNIDDDDGFGRLVENLSRLSAWLEAKESARVNARVAKMVRQAMNNANGVRKQYHLSILADSLSKVSDRLDAKEARDSAITIIHAMPGERDYAGLREMDQSLADVIGNPQRDIRAQAVAGTIACFNDCQCYLGALLLLHPALEPFPRRLADQDLIELLKNPVCNGKARRVVLDQLGIQHRRVFADHWEFVRFAKEKNLGLDFTSPPRLAEPSGVHH